MSEPDEKVVLFGCKHVRGNVLEWAKVWCKMNGYRNPRFRKGEVHPFVIIATPAEESS